jgi:hypothetical protein
MKNRRANEKIDQPPFGTNRTIAAANNKGDFGSINGGVNT